VVSPSIFDCDVHAIPARKDEPEHWHYDVRFLFEADDSEPLVVSEESKELAWVALEEVAALGGDASGAAHGRQDRASAPAFLTNLPQRSAILITPSAVTAEHVVSPHHIRQRHVVREQRREIDAAVADEAQQVVEAACGQVGHSVVTKRRW